MKLYILYRKDKVLSTPIEGFQQQQGTSVSDPQARERIQDCLIWTVTPHSTYTEAYP